MYIRGFYTEEPEAGPESKDYTQKELVSMNWLEYQQLVKDISTQREMQAFISKRIETSLNIGK